MHIHCLHWLKSTGLLFLNAFCRPCISTTKGGVQFGCGDLIWLPLSVHICLGLVVEYWFFVGASTHHSFSEFYYLCLISPLFKLLPPPIPPCAPSTHPLIYTGPILIHSMKEIIKTGENQPLSTCRVSCTKANG